MIFEAYVFAHIKPDKLEIRVVKCVFVGYPENMKSYKLWKVKFGELKLIIIMDVTLGKTRKRMKCKDMAVKASKSMMESTQFKAEVPPRDTIDEEEVKTHVSSASERQLVMALDYHLTRDSVRRVSHMWLNDKMFSLMKNHA